MQEKHTKAKETDITSVLVITFVILVAALIAKVAGDFTSRTTSTSTKATQDSCQTWTPLNDGSYYAGKDFCAAVSKETLLRKCSTYGFYQDNTKLYACGIASQCCRNYEEVGKLGNSRCISQTGKSTSYCAVSGSVCTNAGHVDSGIKCAFPSGLFLQKGACCKLPEVTPSPTPSPTPFLPASAASCPHKDGIKYDCTKTFNMSGNFANLTPVCVKTSTNVQNPSQGSLTYVCGYTVSNQFSGVVCNGLQTTNKVYKADGTLITQCLVGNKKLPLPHDTNNVACTMMKYGGVNSLSDKQCSDMAGKVSDPSQ